MSTGYIFPTRAVSITLTTPGDDWEAFGDQPCRAMDLVAPLNVDIVYRRGTGSIEHVVPAGTSRLVVGIANTSIISVKREDGAATSTVVTAEALD